MEQRRPRIDYPLRWTYKVIGSDAREIGNAVAGVLEGRDYELSFSNFSPRGRYLSMTLEVLVESDEVRNRIFASLGALPEVKIVL
jgi:putative lipoic acid-binding regulatory protein